MDKLPERVEIGQFEVMLRERGVCDPTDCPLRRALARSQEISSVRQAKKIWTKEGLVCKRGFGNGYYGAGEPRGCMTEAKKVIFTADCIHGIDGLEIRNCGSGLIQDSSIQSTDRVMQTVDFIKAAWMRENSF